MADQGIYKAMIGVMKDIGPIGKNQRNDSQRYMFRGIDDLYNAIQPAMVNNGVLHIPCVMESEHFEERRINNYNKEVTYTHALVRVRHTFFAEDGSSVEAITTGEAMDTSDKAFTKAQTASYKYALFHIFNIPTEEEKKTQEGEFAEKDADATSPGAPPEERQSAQKGHGNAQRSHGNACRGAESAQTGSQSTATQNAPQEPQGSSQPVPQGQGTGTPQMAGRKEHEVIAKLCEARSERKPAPFRTQDIYKKFGCQMETCTMEQAYQIMAWFKRNYPEIEV